MTHPTANNLYTTANGSTSTAPFVEVFLPRNPTINDVNYQVQQRWWNTVSNIEFMLAGFTTVGGFLQANWQQVATGAVTVETLTGDDNVPVMPNLNNINVKGGASGGILFSSGGLGNLDAQVQVDNTTIHINGGDQLAVIGSAILGSIPVDHTGAAPNPVVPNGSSQIAFTGTQIAAGSTANVIRTESDVANTVTIAIQRSETAAASTPARNGVCHFNSAQFMVDGNGFVSVSGAGFSWNQITMDTALLAENGYICQSPGGTLVLTLPAASNVGDTIRILLDGATGFQIAQPNAGSQIRYGNSLTTLGVGGSLSSTGTGDAIELVCVTTNARWQAQDVIGNLTVV